MRIFGGGGGVIVAEEIKRLAELADPLAAFAQPLDALATEVARGKRTRRAAAHGAPEAQDANVSRDDHPNRDTRPA
ncbi:hypothetical protein [Nocardia wallacei]|uniref:hypothetical protein n=1 Tax=Nocardia wallacei TaxID=480035 RepID=UPI0024580C98|nr:hypothetical protein [Nocardia wallacei]